MKHRELRYDIDYITADGAKRGQEPCTVTVHSDGQRTIRARSEIFDTEIVRDVVYTVDATFRPVDCFIRVRQYEKVIGSTWFSFDGSTAECQGLTANEGRIAQRFDLAAVPESFITHAVSTDVWHCANIKKDPNLGLQLIDPIPSCSPLANGASGPMLGLWPMTAEYIGVETIDVPAGSFEAEHVRYVELDGSLWLEMWCTNDADRVMLKMHYPVYDSSYVLASLYRDAN